jgi:alkylation response protein AidB-like acyl-CoA dehydrogenase
MNLEFSEDQKFVQHTAREFLTKNAGLDVCRKVLEAKDATHDPSLWKGVAEMGWLGAVVPEQYGGAGLGYLELVLIAEEVGRALAPIPFSSSVALCTEAILQFGSEAQKQKWLPRLAAGDVIGTFALAEGPGDPDVASVSTRFASGKLGGTKLPVLDGEAAGVAVVVAQGEQGPVLTLLDLSTKGVTRTPIESFDPSRSLAKLELRDAGAELLGGVDGGAERVATLLDRAAVVIGFEQLGGATRALEMTREFAMGRYAFGRPIASFQALKHRLADLYAKIEIARSNGYYAAWALSSGNDELALAACSFRAAASDAFEAAAQEMIQIHGGVGFTWEYDCHLFYRRARWLAAAIGTASSWRDVLVTRLVERQAHGGADAHAE